MSSVCRACGQIAENDPDFCPNCGDWTASWWPVGSHRRYSPQFGQKSGSFSAICPQARQAVLTRPQALAALTGSATGIGRAPAS